MLPRPAHPQGGEIRHRSPEGASEVVPARTQLRHPELPGREGGADPVDLVSEVTLAPGGEHLHAVLHGEHVDSQLPALAWLERDLVADRSRLDLAGTGEQRLGLAVELVGGAEQEPVLRLVEEGRNELTRKRVSRVSERDIERLDREDVGEVRADLERQLELERSVGVVDEDHVLLHPVADEAPPGDRDLVGRSPPTGGLRRNQTDEKYSTFPCESRSGRAPLTVRRSRDRKRVSESKKPVVGSPRSPNSSDTQNVAPSRIVICVTPFLLVPDDELLAPLLEGLEDDLVDVHVRRPRDGEDDAVRDVVRRDVPHTLRTPPLSCRRPP